MSQRLNLDMGDEQGLVVTMIAQFFANTDRYHPRGVIIDTSKYFPDMLQDAITNVDPSGWLKLDERGLIREGELICPIMSPTDSYEMYMGMCAKEILVAVKNFDYLSVEHKQVLAGAMTGDRSILIRYTE